MKEKIKENIQKKITVSPKKRKNFYFGSFDKKNDIKVKVPIYKDSEIKNIIQNKIYDDNDIDTDEWQLKNALNKKKPRGSSESIHGKQKNR